MRRRVGKYQLASGQSLQGSTQSRLPDNLRRQIVDIMRGAQKMLRVDGMVAHQADQGGAITLPVMAPQFTGGSGIEAEMRLQIGRHCAVDMRKDMRAGVVQGVIEIKHPDTVESHSLRSVPLDQCTDAFTGQHLEQQRVFNAAVNNMT